MRETARRLWLRVVVLGQNESLFVVVRVKFPLEVWKARCERVG